LLGIRLGKDVMDRDAAIYDDSDDEIAHDEEDVDVDPDVADGEEIVVGPRFFELEPFPQDVFDEFTRLQKEEEETA